MHLYFISFITLTCFKLGTFIFYCVWDEARHSLYSDITVIPLLTVIPRSLISRDNKFPLEGKLLTSSFYQASSVMLTRDSHLVVWPLDFYSWSFSRLVDCGTFTPVLCRLLVMSLTGLFSLGVFFHRSPSASVIICPWPTRSVYLAQ